MWLRQVFGEISRPVSDTLLINPHVAHVQAVKLISHGYTPRQWRLTLPSNNDASGCSEQYFLELLLDPFGRLPTKGMAATEQRLPHFSKANFDLPAPAV